LMFGNVPSINTLHSIFLGMHRPLQYSTMNDLRKNMISSRPSSLDTADAKSLKALESHPLPNCCVIADPIRKRALEQRKKWTRNWNEEYKYDLPLVPMRYFPNTQSDLTATDAINKQLGEVAYPVVVKVATAHAGYGKIRMKNKDDMDDLKSVLALGTDYYTTEPLVAFSYEYRIQRIGKNTRGFRRNSDTSWKGNWGNIRFEDHQLEDFDVLWADRIAELFGGMDIVAIDVLCKETGERVILEINDTACGLMYEHEKEDTQHIKTLLLDKMNAHFKL